MKKIAAAVLLLALLAGCGAGDHGAQAPADEPPPPLETDETASQGGTLPPEGAEALADFGVRLFQRCLDGGNVLVSPLSVVEAMAMAANGAAGETLSQMEQAFGLGLEELNKVLRLYGESLSAGEGDGLRLANGIWLNSGTGLKVKEPFLQAGRELYGADVRETAFDEAAREAINAWVSERTQGRIGQIVDALDPAGAMVLVNALTFDGDWEDVYREDQIQSGAFTAAGGEVRETEMMHSTEGVYLRDDRAVGFVKYYEGRDYAFAALLPDEGVSLQDYAASLSGEKLLALLDGAEETAVEAVMPKFSAEYGAELRPVLAGMGMADAFGGARADFSGIADRPAGELYIDRVIHKTFIAVDERGTEAGAATAVEFRVMAMLGGGETVTLDRPFVYALIDCRNDLPLFLGAVTDVG